MGDRLTHARMDHYQAALFFVALSFFTAWLSILSYQIKKTVAQIDSHGDVEETKETINQIAQALAVVYENMPTMDRIQELLPEFHINQQDSGSKYFFDFIGKYFMDSSNTQSPLRGDRGQFHAPTPQIEEAHSPQSETNAESPSRS